jgi:gamma-D-glutamyl-L-lysine dipeptidyl-peptidase
MKEQIQIVIDAFFQKHMDRRINVCNLQIKSFENNRLVLAGEVLDSTTLSELKEEIIKPFPKVEIDIKELSILRKPIPEYLWVSTNLTSLHGEPSWLAEMTSQLLYGMKLEKLKEKGKWVFVRQEDGYLGWAYAPYLSKVEPFKPTHLITALVGGLFEKPDKSSNHLSRLYSGTRVNVAGMQGDFVQILNHGEKKPSTMPGGWMHKDRLLSLDQLPVNVSGKRQAMLDAAFRLYGVPYLWGGCTTNGIDCSGLAQLCHRFAGVDIKRDADMQKNGGQPVEYPFKPGDLVFFGDDNDLTRISHVGISLGGWEMIHSSRSQNGVYVDNIQSVNHLCSSFVGGCTYL